MSTNRPENGAELITSIAHGYLGTAALKAGLDLEIFTHVAHGDDTVEKLAAAERLPVRSTRILCDALVGLGLLTKTSGRYALPESTRHLLVKESPAYMGAMLDVIANPLVWNAAAAMTDVVKAGHSLMENNAETPCNPFWEIFQRSSRQMAAVAGRMVADIAAQVLGEPGPAKVLDIACGSGIYGFSVLQRFPQATLVSVDWPNVLELTRPVAEQYGVVGRTELRPGDIFKDDLGTGYDLVLAVNIYHHFGVARNIELSGRLCRAMAPGGALIVVDFVADREREHSHFAQTFALAMLLWTENGDTYTFGEYQQMLEKAGLREVELREITGAPAQAIVARK